jgi:hypothetical protein
MRVEAHLKNPQLLQELLSAISKPKRQVRSLKLFGNGGNTVSLLQLPAMRRLNILQFINLRVQLQPSVVASGMLLQKLVFNDCIILDGTAGPAAALQQLPDLEHLSIANSGCRVPTVAFAGLKHLTYLQLEICSLESPAAGSPEFPRLPQGLVHLQVPTTPLHNRCHFSVDTLSSLGCLTHLALSGESTFVDAGALAGKTRLQHLQLSNCKLVANHAGMAPALVTTATIEAIEQLLGAVGFMVHLTHLDLSHSLMAFNVTAGKVQGPQGSDCKPLLTTP